jgi:hypothetical protein
MKTPCTLLVALLVGTTLGSVALATERDSHGLAKLIAEKLAARRNSAAILEATDFQGTDIGCIILPRNELRPFGYPGHGFFCEVAATGEVLGGLVNKKGRQLCEIRGFYTADFCYDFDICEVPESLCVVQ